MNNVKVSKDGHIYLRVPVETLALMKRDGYDCYVSDTDGDKVVKLTADRHVSIEDVVWVYVGNASYLNKARMDKFGEVKDMADYINANGKLPWGWRGIVRYKGWERLPEKGISVVVTDGLNIMRYWNKEKKVTVSECQDGSLSTNDARDDESH